MSKLSQPMSRRSRTNFVMSRISRPTARLCNLGLNPDAARPLARLISRLSSPYVQTFQTQTLGATAIWVSIGKRRGHGGYGATFATKERLSRPRRDFPDQGGDGATFQTKAETELLSRPRRKRRYFPNQGVIGATFQTKAEMVRLSRTRRRRRDQ